MSNTFKQTFLAMTSAAALFLSVAPSMAAITGFNELETIVTDELKGLGIATDHVKQLTLGQIAELAALTESTDGSDADRKAAAQEIIDSAIHPQKMVMGNAGAAQLEAELKADLESVGIPLPAREKLSFAKVIDLTTVFDSTDMTNADKKAAAEKVLAAN